MIQIACDSACRLFPDFKYGWLASEFKARLPRELDFSIEAENADRCRCIFSGNPRVKVPDIYHKYTRGRVLVMSCEEGVPVTHVKQMLKEGIDLKQLSLLISQAFNKMIFEEGFVHADPHPGNLFARRMPNGQVQLVILDHGIYTALSEDTRLSYTKLWRGILSQDETMIKHASHELGADFFQLFTAMIVNRTYDDVMDKEKKVKMKARLGDVNDSKTQQALQGYALYYHKDIVEILDQIKRELLLVMKTNNYLRAIDRRLGNPHNTFSVINETSWKVYKKDVWR